MGDILIVESDNEDYGNFAGFLKNLGRDVSASYAEQTKGGLDKAIFPCKMCGKLFNSKEAQTRHIEHKHHRSSTGTFLHYLVE